MDKRYFRYFDWLSFVITLCLLGIGLLFVFSSTYTPEKPFSLFFKKQLFGALSGLTFYFLISMIDVRRYIWLSDFLYGAVLLLLSYTILAGWVGMGAKRWISLYLIRFQPSELTKCGLPLFIGHYFYDHRKAEDLDPVEPYPFSSYIFPLCILGLSFILIRRQPDLGTALVVLFSGLVMLWFIGLHTRFFIITGLIFLFFLPFGWTVLKPYQQKRILVLCGYGDMKKERYHVEQSKIAIGSGGLWGKGILQGTQNKLGFLPEDHNDFIFSVICEEWGFCGAVIILFLFFLLFMRLVYIIICAQVLMNQVIGLGLLIHILLSFCINVGMVTGMLPVVGIPLPLMSYGVSNLWITLASLGWLQNIAIRRFYY